MVIPDLPEDILHKIIQIVGEADACNLGSFIRACKVSNRLVFTEYVLRTCNVFWLFCKHDREGITSGGKARSFFEKCFLEDNPQALYLESLNLVIREGDFGGGIDLLEANAPDHAHSTLAAALLSVCVGEGDKASQLFQLFSKNHGSLLEDKARHIGDEVKRDIALFKPSFLGTYKEKFIFPDDEITKLPECAYPHLYVRGCNVCYMFQCAIKVCEML